MGATLSLQKEVARGSSNRSSASGSSIYIFDLIIKPVCCLKTRKAKKRTMLQQLPEKKSSKVMKLTLEECLSSSPGSKPDRFINGGELYVFKNYCYNKVYLSSSSGAHHHNHDMALSLASKTRKSFSLERITTAKSDIDEHHDGGTESNILGVSSSSMSRNKSGKLKKKVRFKLPEEADFIIIYSPEDCDCERLSDKETHN